MTNVYTVEWEYNTLGSVRGSPRRKYYFIETFRPTNDKFVGSTGRVRKSEIPVRYRKCVIPSGSSEAYFNCKRDAVRVAQALEILAS